MDAAPHPSRLGVLLQRAVVGSALAVLGFSALVAVLAPVGLWRWWLAWPGAVGLLVGGFRLARRVPTSAVGRTPAMALVLVTALWVGWVVATHSEQVLPRRDAGSYLQQAQGLVDTGRRTVPLDAAALGGPEMLAIDGVDVGSPAFFRVGPDDAPAIEPQFTLAPAALASLPLFAAPWTSGLVGVALVSALLMGFGLLGLGLLVARWCGPWWGVLATGATGLLFPVLHTARMPYSENAATLLLAGALLALTAAVADDARAAGVIGAVLLGGAALVRVDAPREALLVLPVLAACALAGARWVRPAAGALAASLVVGLGVTTALSWSYVSTIGDSLLPLVGLTLLSALVSGSAVWWVRRRRARGVRGGPSWMPWALGVGTALVGLGLAARPLVMVARGSPTSGAAWAVAGMQLREGLTVDRGRTYTEQTVGWLAWWVGWPALVVALAALAVLVFRLAARMIGPESGGVPSWAPALVVGAGSTVLTLLRPGITPDHPWAERRLLVALPFVVALVVVAAAWLWRRLWQRTGGGRTASGVVVAALVVPMALATAPHAGERVEAGSVAALAPVCERLGPTAGQVFLLVESRAANEWPPLLRRCGAAVLVVGSAQRRDAVTLRGTVDAVRSVAVGRGLTVRLVSADPAVLTELGVSAPHTLVDAVVWEDPRLLVHRPEALVPLDLRLFVG